jgi:hypothetical protein
MRHLEPQIDMIRKESLHVIVKMPEVQNKERILKAARNW